MRAFSGLCGLLVGLASGAAMAQGPVLTPVPANTCPSGKPLKVVWVANEVASDAGPVGPGFAETMIVCHSTEKTGGAAIDVWVEFFDFAGVPAGTTSICAVSAGNTAPFVTVPFFPPYVGAVAAPAVPLVPMGSVRMMATKPKIACDVTVFDTGGPASGVSLGPVWSKDVTVTKARAPQKGD